jgi:hypothetical protein
MKNQKQLTLEAVLFMRPKQTMPPSEQMCEVYHMMSLGYITADLMQRILNSCKRRALRDWRKDTLECARRINVSIEPKQRARFLSKIALESREEVDIREARGLAHEDPSGVASAILNSEFPDQQEIDSLKSRFGESQDQEFLAAVTLMSAHLEYSNGTPSRAKKLHIDQYEKILPLLEYVKVILERELKSAEAKHRRIRFEEIALCREMLKLMSSKECILACCEIATVTGEVMDLNQALARLHEFKGGPEHGEFVVRIVEAMIACGELFQARKFLQSFDAFKVMPVVKGLASGYSKLYRATHELKDLDELRKVVKACPPFHGAFCLAEATRGKAEIQHFREAITCAGSNYAVDGVIKLAEITGNKKDFELARNLIAILGNNLLERSKCSIKLLKITGDPKDAECALDSILKCAQVRDDITPLLDLAAAIREVLSKKKA